MKKNVNKIIKVISKYFEEHSVCDGLIHFGSSVKSNKFNDVDFLCYFKDYQPKSHLNILKALYFLKEKFPEVNFSYNEYIIDKFIKNKINFSFVSFGKGIKDYSAFKYSLSQSYNLLFGTDPIKNAKIPSKKECMEYSVMLHNIKKEFPMLQLKSYLINALLAKRIYVDKKELISKFEEEYKIRIPKILKDFFKTNKEINNNESFIELEKLYQAILKANNFKDKQNNRVELVNDSPAVRFKIEVFNKINSMLAKKESKEKILSYLEKKDKEYQNFRLKR